MSIDINNDIDAALVGIHEQIKETHSHMPKVFEAYGVQGDRITFLAAMDKLERLLRTASDSVEVFQNYNGQYDRIERRCWGDRPEWYEVQCRLCAVQRPCAEETDRRHVDTEERPDCFGRNPLAKHKICRDCRLFRLCLKEMGECPPSGKSGERSSRTGTETTDGEIGEHGEMEK